jgi:SM-20-related protein
MPTNLQLSGTLRQPPPWTAPFPAVILDEFLVAEEWRALLSYTLSHERQFSPSEVVRADGHIAVDSGYRRSRVLFNLGVFHGLFRQRMLTFLPYLLARLGYGPFPVSDVEVQLTGTNHGEFFRVHSDNDAGITTGRQLTFVYFFFREPRRFGGGDLRIFDSKRPVDASRRNEAFRTVYPRQNQVVVFPSAYMHEILPVVCPSRQFADSRFTVNGWLHR